MILKKICTYTIFLILCSMLIFVAGMNKIFAAPIYNVCFSIALIVVIIFYGFLNIDSISGSFKKRGLMLFNKSESENLYSDNSEKKTDIEMLRERFISTLNHDLKTPTLAQIRSLDLLLEGNFGNLTPEQYKMIELTKESCQSMLDIIVTVLFNYKFENNEVKLNEMVINPKELVDECCEELSDNFNDKLLNLRIFSDRSSNYIFGDQILLKQAISNIISNSITYAYKKSNFEINVKNIGQSICISIINDGIQLSEKTIRQIFDCYECNSSKYNKIGFGLKSYLAKQIIQIHNGLIVVKNNNNSGTRFEILLPAYRHAA